VSSDLLKSIGIVVINLNLSFGLLGGQHDASQLSSNQVLGTVISHILETVASNNEITVVTLGLSDDELVCHFVDVSVVPPFDCSVG
jgi:hypothetical protein